MADDLESAVLITFNQGVRDASLKARRPNLVAVELVSVCSRMRSAERLTP